MDKGSHVREMTDVYNKRAPPDVVWLHSTEALGESFPEAILIETAFINSRSSDLSMRVKTCQLPVVGMVC